MSSKSMRTGPAPSVKALHHGNNGYIRPVRFSQRALRLIAIASTVLLATLLTSCGAMGIGSSATGDTVDLETKSGCVQSELELLQHDDDGALQEIETNVRDELNSTAIERELPYGVGDLSWSGYGEIARLGAPNPDDPDARQEAWVLVFETEVSESSVENHERLPTRWTAVYLIDDGVVGMNCSARVF